jgi:hypothetical protein
MKEKELATVKEKRRMTVDGQWWELSKFSCNNTEIAYCSVSYFEIGRCLSYSSSGIQRLKQSGDWAMDLKNNIFFVISLL